MLTTIIFSKDRPAQLDLLLRSIAKYAPDVRPIVIVKNTNEQTIQAYNEVANHFFLFESDFVKNVQWAFAQANGIVQFLVDDDLYVRPLDLPAVENLLADESVQGVSLRQAPYMDRCYTENMRTDPPMFSRDYKWHWPGTPGDWGYPNSVDGTIYRTKDIAEAIKAGKWKTPSQLEPALRPCMNRPLLACFQQQVIANIPNSSVQTTGPANRNGGLDDAELTERFLRGERIVLDGFANLQTPAAHWEIAYQWQRPHDIGPPSMGG